MNLAFREQVIRAKKRFKTGEIDGLEFRRQLYDAYCIIFNLHPRRDWF